MCCAGAGARACVCRGVAVGREGGVRAVGREGCRQGAGVARSAAAPERPPARPTDAQSPPPPPPLPSPLVLQTLGNFVKATFYALSATYGFLTPELWRPTVFTPSPLQEYSDVSAQMCGRV